MIASFVASYEELRREYRRQSFEKLNNYLSKVYD